MADINETPQEGIDQYDAGMSTDPFAAFSAVVNNQSRLQDQAVSQLAARQYAQNTNAGMEREAGLVPEGVGMDPNVYSAPTFSAQDLAIPIGGLVGSLGGPTGTLAGAAVGAGISQALGSESQLSRSLAAGTGQLIEGTGDTYEFLKAAVTPWDEDVDQKTTIGDFLQRKGSEIQNKNQVFIPEEMKNVGWAQLADPRFWATDVAKLLPYSMSFFLPAGAAAKSIRLLLNSNKAYKAARTLGVGEKLYKPVISKATKRQAKRRGLQEGEEFAKMEMRKGIDIATASIGGGVGGNFAEGAFVAGETMQQALADGLTPQEAQAAATQVWRDNTNWIAADVAQFGLVFGGLGRLAAGFRRIPKPMPFAQKIAPFIQATATGSIEGVAEQYQEVYQEWIKNRAIAEQKGEDYMTYTEFFKSPEMLDVRVSAFALGATMGARGGYVDAIAERDYQIQEQQTRLGDLMDVNKFEQAQSMRKDIIAYTVIDSNGNAVLAKSRVERMVAEGQMKEEVGLQLIEAIEQYEDIYESSHKGNRLSQAGKRQIFLSRVEIAEREAAIERSNESREEELKQVELDIQDEALLEQTKQEINDNFDKEVNIYNQEIQEFKDLIQNLATVKLGKLTKDKTRVKKSSVGLTPEQFGEFTTEGRQEQVDKPGIIKRATQAVTKGVKAVAKGVGKAVQTVREQGVKEAATKTIKSEAAQKLSNFFRTQIGKGTNFTKKYLDKVSPGASQKIEDRLKSFREELGERLPTKEEAKQKASEIVDSIKKGDLTGATTAVINEIKSFVENKIKDSSIGETLSDVVKSAKAKIDAKTEELQERTEKVKETTKETETVDKTKDSLTPDKIQNHKKAKYANTKEMVEKGKPILFSTQTKTVGGVGYRFRIEEFEDGTLLFNVSELDKGDLPVKSLTEKEYKSLIEKSKKESKKKSKKSVKQETSNIKVTESSESSTPKKVQEMLDKINKKHTNLKVTDKKKPTRVYLTRVDETASIIKGILRSSLEDKFPNVRIEFVNRQLIEGFGAPASAVFFSSTILVNPNAAMQTDLIHELSHPYYQSIARTPLQKRLNDLLIKRKIVTPNGNVQRLIDNVQYNYPLLTKYEIDGQIKTGGDLITYMQENRRRDIDSTLSSLLDTAADAANSGNTTAYKNALQSFFAQLVNDGSIKRLADKDQDGLLEESFAYSNEDFNRKGGISNVIDNKTEARKYESILKRLYKRIAGLAKEDEAKAAVEKVIPEVRLMNYEEMMKYIQNNFNTLNVDNQLKQNSYNKGAMLKQASFDVIPFKGLFDIVQQQVVSKGKRGEDAVQDITKELYRQNNKTYNTQTQEAPQGVSSIQHDMLLRRVRAGVDRSTFKEYNRIVNNLIASVNERLDQGERSDDVLTFSFNTEEEIVAEENDKGNIYDQEEVLFGDTTSKLIQAYSIEESKKDDKNPVNVKDLLSELHSIGQKTKKQNTFTFVTQVTESQNGEVIRFVKFLKSKLKKDTLVDALLLEMSIDFANKKIETMKEVGFMRAGNGVTTWVPGVSLNTDEARWNASMVEQANRRWFAPKLPEDKNSVKNIIENLNKDFASALNTLFSDSPYYQFIDKRKIGAGNIYNYKGKRYRSLEVLYMNNRTDFFKRGKLQIKDGFNVLLADLIVQSRSKNYITQVNDVAENPTLIINKENSLHNKNENYADLAGKDIMSFLDLMKDLGFYNDSNYTFKNIYAEMLSAVPGQELDISMLSGVFSTPQATKQDSRRNRKYVKMDSQELMLTDFNDFLLSVSRYSLGETAYYDQPIAVFGSAKRRYYIKTPIAQTADQRQELLQMALDAGYNTATYKEGDKVNPFKIVKKNGKLVLSGLEKETTKFLQQVKKDPNQIKQNTLIKTLDRTTAKNYLLNYSINKFFAQEMFIGKHNQSKDEIDYIKRAEGAIKRHTPHDRNNPIEFVAFKDVTDFDGFNATDAQAYVLPGDGQIIRDKFGSMRQVGNQFKHVYDYVETNNTNPLMFGKRTFAKFKIDEITSEMEENSPYLKKIANILRARKAAIGSSKHIPGPEITGRLHEYIPIATFESALKVYAPGTDYMYDLENTTEEDIVNRQDEIYNSKGVTEEDLLNDWKGLSGEGFGLQVELDKERHSFHMPSQLFGHHHTNLNPDEEAIVRRMHELAAKSMIGFEETKSKDVIYKDQSTPEERQRDIDFLKKLIGEEFFGNLNTSLADYAPGLHPQLHRLTQQLASSRLVKFGTKAMFGGTIAYQTSPIGRNLQSYKKVSDLVDIATDETYKNALNRLLEEGKDFVVSEAIIPASAKKDGIKVGDLILGTRIPAHGKQSSVVFVVKGFAAEGQDGARSTIAIPSKVSNVLGSDLDGDAIYLNYKHVGNVPGTTKTSPLGQEARVQTNLLKDYQVSANELLDLNIQLLGDIEYDSQRFKEITTPIDIEKLAEDAIKNVESFYGEKLIMESQMTPIGDSQYFNDNVPAQNMIGTIASLQRVLNVMAGHNVGFTFGINIKGYDEINSLVDTFNEEKPEGNAFAVAQLLNIVLDNAKYQYANKLGLTPNTVNQFVLLARSGVSISDIATIMNHPIVKLYDKYRGDQSIMTVNNPNRAIQQVLIDYFKMGKAEAVVKTRSFARSGDINLDINSLKGKNRNAEMQLIDLLYKTEKLTDEISTIGRALSAHKSIPQNGHDAQNLINTINEDKKGSLLNPNTMGNFRSDPLVKHNVSLLQKQVDRQKSTSFMYTPEARQVIEYIEDTKKIKLDFTRNEHRSLIEDYYLSKVSEAIPVLNYNNRSLAEVYKALETFSQEPGDNFVKKYLLFSNLPGNPYYENTIQINPNEVNKFSVEETLQEARNMFTELPQGIKDLLLQYDYLKNGLGFKSKSLSPIFAKDYIREKFAMLDDLLQSEINKSVSIDDPSVVNKANRLILDHADIFKNDTDKIKITQIENKKLRGQQQFEPSGTAKLKLNKREFYQDHLQELTKTLSYNEYLRFLGYSPDAVKGAEAKIKRFFEDKYQRYLDSLSKVEALEKRLESKGIEKMSIKELVDQASELQDREDELASPKLLHKLHLAIGNKAMRIQSQKIADKTGEEFNLEQEDISAIRKWFGANDMTSKRPEVQYMLNEIEKEYRKYVREVQKLVKEIDEVDRKLKRSKKITLKGIFNPRARQQELYGKMFTQEITPEGKNNGIKLVTRDQFEASNPSIEERNFYNKYMEITKIFRDKLGKDGMGEYYIPHVQMGNLEALSARGLLGLYANYLGSTTNIDNVIIGGTNADGKYVEQSFKYFKDLYLTEGGELTMPSNRKINELRKLKAKAEKQLKTGKHVTGDPIVASDLEMDTLMEGGLFSRFNAGRTVRAKELTSFDLAENLKQYVRSVSFVHGVGEFNGMNNTATLIDAVIAVNKQMGNENTAEYVTKVWRQGFMRKQRQTSMFGENFDKATQFMVRWTALVHLGFSAAVGVGNILAGKFQELRAKGGSKFILGEKRFWTSYTKDGWKGMDIIKKYRIVELSFSDVVGSRDAFSQIESWAFLPMELSERWIQGAAFLGELTQEEYDSGEVSEERVMQINSRIATMHGEGYTQLDQRLLSMYSLGVAAQQFKRWFITLAYNRLKQEDINRFGEKTVGSYRATYNFVNNMFTGNKPLTEIRSEFEKLEDYQKDAINATLRGMGLTAMILLLASLTDDDDAIGDSLQKLSNDAMIFTDTKRFVNYTIPPASISTGRNALQFSKELVTFERYQRDSKFGDRGDLKARGTARKILPFKAVTEPLLEK